MMRVFCGLTFANAMRVLKLGFASLEDPPVPFSAGTAGMEDYGRLPAPYLILTDRSPGLRSPTAPRDRLRGNIVQVVFCLDMPEDDFLRNGFLECSSYLDHFGNIDHSITEPPNICTVLMAEILGEVGATAPTPAPVPDHRSRPFPYRVTLHRPSSLDRFGKPQCYVACGSPCQSRRETVEAIRDWEKCRNEDEAEFDLEFCKLGVQLTFSDSFVHYR
jgi:hypothetical protein